MHVPWLRLSAREMKGDLFWPGRKSLWMHPGMSRAPLLPEGPTGGPVARRTALLINPFYAKDPHGSYGYHWLYRRLFSHCSIWRRRPPALSAVPAYLAMSYLYKRANWLWHWLIRWQRVHEVWRPLIAWNRRRHLALRKHLVAGRWAGSGPEGRAASGPVIPAGV